MALPQEYVLVLDEQQRWLPQADLPLASDHCPFVVAASAEHAVEQARQATPCLVILIGENHAWFKHQVHALRHSTHATSMTIVALTESASPNWQPERDMLDLDGFLVKPVTDDVLMSLVQSAIIKQSYH
ncbi:MAG: hypothetical protein F6J95_005450 [Leptolyngbya sp. SIO1E4]|nr:hypothetical protein [Leptolyngbya sp. SIO1E4]